MQISISSIRDRRGATLPFFFSLSREELTDLPGDVRAASDVEVRGSVTNAGESMLVRAAVRGLFEATCSRCLQPARVPVEAALEERFRREDVPYVPEDSGSAEDDAEVNYYRGERIDLGDVVREHVALHLPMKPVCRDDCQGLCPRCGANRNETPCQCRIDDVDPRLAALQAWLERQSPAE